MLATRDFWKRLGDKSNGVLLVVLLESWKDIGDNVGIEGVEFAEQSFASLCQFATRTAAEQSRLSVSVFAAFWPQLRAEETAIAMLQRWLPLQVASRAVSFSMAGSWTAHTMVGEKSVRELVERVRASLDDRINQLPDRSRFRPLTTEWDDPS